MGVVSCFYPLAFARTSGRSRPIASFQAMSANISAPDPNQPLDFDVGGLDSDQIESIEAALGCELPEDVRKQYADAGGLLGPTNCKLLYYLDDDAGSSIIRMNKLRKEDWFPKDFRGFAIVGDDGCGNMICFDPSTRKAILWNPEDGDWIQEERNTVTELWDHIRSQYDDTGTELGAGR